MHEETGKKSKPAHELIESVRLIVWGFESIRHFQLITGMYLFTNRYWPFFGPETAFENDNNGQKMKLNNTFHLQKNMRCKFILEFCCFRKQYSYDIDGKIVLM